MKKSKIVFAKFTRVYLNASEYLAYALMRSRKPKDIKIEKNISYGESKLSKLDYIYRTDGQKKPLLFYIHGGGWICGVKIMRRPYCTEFAKEGYFVVNIEYDKAPEYPFPHQLRQIAQAFDYVIDRADELNVDTDRVVIAGESAGAYFAAYMAVLAKNNALREELAVNFSNADKMNIKATALICGAYGFDALSQIRFPNLGLFLESYTYMPLSVLKVSTGTRECELFSPLNFIDETFPPAVLVKASNDSLKTETDTLAAKLTALNRPHTTFLATGVISLHCWCIATKLKAGKRCFAVVREFINKWI